VRAKAARELDRLRTALERRREPALAVRERDDHVLLGPTRLDDVAVIRQLVLAEGHAKLRNRDGDHCGAGDGLGDVRVRLEVDLPVQSERSAARSDRRRVVPPREP
jgi:hypothetical protein